MGYSFVYHGICEGKSYFQLIANDDFESRFGEQFVFAYSSKRDIVIRVDRYCYEMNKLYTFTRDADGNIVYPTSSRVTKSDTINLLSKLLDINVFLVGLGYIKDVLKNNEGGKHESYCI